MLLFPKRDRIWYEYSDFYLALHAFVDREAIFNTAKTGAIILYEDHYVRTGLGSLVANFLADRGVGVRFRKLGATHYGSSGKPDELYRIHGLDVNGRVQAVLDEIKKN